MAGASDQAISDYKLFLYMQLHNSDGIIVGNAYPIKTVAFAKVEVRSGDTIATDWFRQERNGFHAEEALLMPDGPIVKFVEKNGGSEERPVVRIVIYQNYSPCAACSLAIQNFFRANKWKIDFVFVALHNIARPSCKYRYDTQEQIEKQEQRQNQQERKCNHSYDGLPVQIVSDKNIEGLYNLQQIGVTVRTFTREDWATLRDHLFQPTQNYLGFFDFKLGEPADGDNCLADFRRAEDEYMQRDLKEILESEYLRRLEKIKVSEQVK